MKKIIRRLRGFTLVEIMVAITILAILAIAAILIYQEVQQRAKIAKVQLDLQAMAKEIEISRETKGEVFYQLIGGDDYADRYCRVGTGPYDPTTPIKDRPLCLDEIRTDWSTFTDMKMPIDPWGNMYTFDANEMEPNFYWQNNTPGIGPNRYCRWDIIKSAGPDGVSWTEDDYIYYVSPHVCKIKEECYRTPGTVLGGHRNNPIDTDNCTDPNAP